MSSGNNTPELRTSEIWNLSVGGANPVCLVEHETDKTIYRPAFKSNAVSLYACSGKQNVIEDLALLDEQGFSGGDVPQIVKTVVAG